MRRQFAARCSALPAYCASDPSVLTAHMDQDSGSRSYQHGTVVGCRLVSGNPLPQCMEGGSRGGSLAGWLDLLVSRTAATARVVLCAWNACVEPRLPLGRPVAVRQTELLAGTAIH